MEQVAQWGRKVRGAHRGADDIPARLIRKAIGDEWEVDLESLKTKPLRVTARKDQDETVLTWAQARDLKHLVWAALAASAEGDPANG